ncbi:MAG: hypothetical protein M0Z42_02380 [Actinomycetota bacterium]|nr:hypothetical protein [Actinomycetota bacterium]
MHLAQVHVEGLEALVGLDYTAAVEPPANAPAQHVGALEQP